MTDLSFLGELSCKFFGCADLIFRIGIASILAFSAGSGYRSRDPNSIFCIFTRFSPTLIHFSLFPNIFRFYKIIVHS